jgi:hypothetical protein
VVDASWLMLLCGAVESCYEAYDRFDLLNRADDMIRALKAAGYVITDPAKGPTR